MRRYFLIPTVLTMILSGCTDRSREAETVTVYTHRHYESDQKLFGLFEERTGIKVNVVNAGADELIQKMRLEGERSPADVLITVDAGRLYRAKSNDLLQPVRSKVMDGVVPAHLRDPESHWFGITKRARIIAYAKDRVQPEELTTYEDLATDGWEGRVLTRTSANVYNQSLMASIIANRGEDFAGEWAEGVVDNMARRPKGNDRDQVKAVYAGEGDIAIVNTYYLGHMLNSPDSEEVKAAESMGIFFPNQEDNGAHINVSGVGLAKYAPHEENAIAFMEFLVSEEAQRIFAGANHEYPVNPDVPVSETIAAWGDFKEDSLNLSRLGELNSRAAQAMDEAGWR